jgi:hypothetical protein
VFGRTLIYNSVLLGKIWFNATQSLMSAKYEQKFQVRCNQYFRQGRKVANISLATRVLPKLMGGLGQLAIHKQMDLLRAKWVIKSMSYPSHPCVIYWHDNVDKLQEHLGLHCPPTVAVANWKKIRPGSPATAKVFPFVIAAFKSWHSLGSEIDTAKYTTVAAQPLFNNKHITVRMPVPNESFFKQVTGFYF